MGIKMRKKLFLITGISFILFAGCKQFVADIEKDLEYWSSSAHIIDIVLPSSSNDIDGYPCVASNDDAAITLKLVNPQNYTFKTPADLGAPSDIVVFEDGVQGSSGAVPVHGIDYEFKQTQTNEVRLIYKKAFLEKSEWSSQNLSASITLYNREGRKFGSRSSKLRANSILPEPKGIALLKYSDSGKDYYVLCFKPEGIDKKINNNTELLHKDLSEIYIKKENEQTATYPLKFNSSNTGFDISEASEVLISLGKTNSLKNDQVPAGMSPDPLPAGPWVICLKTDVEVSTNSPQTTYNVWLKDEKGLFSLPGTKTTNKFKLPDPKISFSNHMNNVFESGVYTPVGQPADSTALLNGTHDEQPDGSSEENAIPIYSAYGNDIQLKIKVNIHDFIVAAGLQIKTYVYRKTESGFQLFSDSTASGGNETFVELSAKSEEVVYRLESYAFLSGFDDSESFVKYYKVIRGVNGDTAPDVPVWGILKKAVEEKTEAGGTLIVRGEIKAPNSSGGVGNHGEIEINKDITIRGKTGKDVDSINANSSALGSNPHRIFNINANGKNVRLEGLTLKNGKKSNADGGAVLHKSGNLHIKDCKFENNEVEGSHKGGAVYYEDGTLTLSGSVELPSTGEGKNDIYIEKSEKFISIASPLTTENVARITPKDYTIGGSPRKVLGSVASVNLASQVSKFTVSPQTTSGGSQKWIIDDRGFLQKLLTGGSSTDNWNTLVTALDSVQNGQILYLSGEYMPNSNNAIIISKSCTIRGMGDAVLNVNKTGTMFRVLSSDGLVTLENLEIKNGKDDTYVLIADTEGSFKLKNVRVNGVKKLVSSDSGDISLEDVIIQGDSDNPVISLVGGAISGLQVPASYLNLRGAIAIPGKIKLIFPAGEDNYKGCIKVCDNKAYALHLDFGSDYYTVEGKQVVFVDPNTGISLADAVANIRVAPSQDNQAWFISDDGHLRKR